MSEKTITHKDLAEKLGVSETTIKSYRRKFPGCFPVASKGKPIRFKAEAQEIALRIRDLFSTGMSVEEVRERLAEDFEWFSPKDAQNKAKENKVKADLPQNFATAVSNMAKSMIALSQQQNAILENMKRIEAMLSEIGLGAFKNIDPNAINNSGKEVMRELASLKTDMRNITRGLTENNSIIAEEHNAFMAGMEHLINALGSSQNSGGSGLKPEPRANIINFDKSSAEPQNVPEHQQGAPKPEFPRHLLSMPLVVRNDEGAYLSAGGKNISRISLNDIKAILAQTYMPPENYSLLWDYGADGWWVSFTQRGIPAPMEGMSIAIQVAEITSARGVSVLEARKYACNGEPQHPTELIRFVTGVGKE